MESTTKTLNELLTSLSVTKWDLLLMGDGSGTTYKTPIGFAALSIDRQSGLRHIFTGGYNHGTIGQAELLPYITALRFDYYSTLKTKLHSRRRVTILSDSQVSVNVGNGDQTAHTNKDIWICFDWFKSVGYDLTWKWVGRNENDIHKLAHKMGNIVRKIIDSEKDIDPYTILPTQGSYTVEPGSDWGFE
jgi:hypothetical protein